MSNFPTDPRSAPAIGIPATTAIKPRAFALELTKGCNLRCGYCYYAQRETAFDPTRAMSREVAEASIDRLFADGPAGEPAHLHFFGGEPLLNVAILRHAVDYAERAARRLDREITFEITTNGTLLDDEIIGFLNDHRVKVGVSFDGPPEIQDLARPLPSGRGSYALAEPRLRRLLASRRGTELEEATHCSVVVTKRDLDLVRIVAHLEQLGFRHIIVTPTTDLSGVSLGIDEASLPAARAALDALAADTLQRLLAGRPVAETWFRKLIERARSRERVERFCDGGRDYLGVTADGAVHLCYRFFEDERFRMGNVVDGIERAVTEQILQSPVDARTTCAQCWARYFCGGGCHHDNVTATGDISDPNPVSCELFRHSMGVALEMAVRLDQAGIGLPLPVPSGDHGGERAQPIMDQPTSPEDWCPARKPGVFFRDLGGEAVVYDPETHGILSLNETAARIWHLCDGAHSLAQIVTDLGAAYDALPDELLGDVSTVIESFRSRGLVV